MQKTLLVLALLLAISVPAFAQQQSPFEAFMQKAQAGDAQSQFIVGSFYLEGQGVSQNVPKALEYFEAAANQHYLRAQAAMAAVYIDASFLPPDPVKAYMWAIIIGNNNQPPADEPKMTANVKQTAVRLIADLEKEMTPEQIEEAKQLAAQWQAAHQ